MENKPNILSINLTVTLSVLEKTLLLLKIVFLDVHFESANYF